LSSPRYVFRVETICPIVAVAGAAIVCVSAT
jgi:hypothetical protein